MLKALLSPMGAKAQTFPYEIIFVSGEKLNSGYQRDQIYLKLKKVTRCKPVILNLEIDSKSNAIHLTHFLDSAVMAGVSVIIRSDIEWIGTQLQPECWVIKITKATFPFLKEKDVIENLCHLIDRDIKIIFELYGREHTDFEKEIDFLAHSGFNFVFPEGEQSQKTHLGFSNKALFLKEYTSQKHTIASSAKGAVQSWLKSFLESAQQGRVSESDCLKFLFSKYYKVNPSQISS